MLPKKSDPVDTILAILAILAVIAAAVGVFLLPLLGQMVCPSRAPC